MKLIKGLTRIIEKFCTLLFIIMTVITFFQVISRYFFGISYFWADEMSIFSMIWLVFLGASISVSHNAHTRIDYFISLFPPKIKKWIEIFNNFICMTFIILVTYYGLDVIKLTMKNVSTGLKIPMGIIYGSLPVSGVLMAIYFAILIYLQIKDQNIEGGLPE
ncbi:MAG: TRAP transporter small permease [Tepidanaerobacteraceae bacterium]|nr:TRAP transporter small permease [Tepidanaerobacteraceae bacterium]